MRNEIEDAECDDYAYVWLKGKVESRNQDARARSHECTVKELAPCHPLRVHKAGIAPELASTEYIWSLLMRWCPGSSRANTEFTITLSPNPAIELPSGTNHDNYVQLSDETSRLTIPNRPIFRAANRFLRVC